MNAHFDISFLEVWYFCSCGSMQFPHPWEPGKLEEGTTDLALVIEHLRQRTREHKITTKIIDRYEHIR